MRQEVLQGIYGAWRIARLDPAALGYFNLTIDGFWRSFLALVILQPFYLLFILLGIGTGDEAAPSSVVGFIVVKLVTFGLGWLAFVLAMIPILRLLKLDSRYVSYIIAWNWAALLQMTVILSMAALSVSGLLPDALLMVLLWAAYFAVLYYAYLVARAGLACDAITAIGVVAFDLVLSIFVDRLGEAVL